MSTIRRQSIFSSIVVYIGFALGFLNTYLFTREGSGLTSAQFGITNAFIALATIMYAVANLGMPTFLIKYFPYYKAHVPDEKNDQLTWAFLACMLGFVVVLIGGIAFKPLIFKWFSNSPELPRYYNWSFVFGFGFTFYLLLEALAWQLRKPVLSNFLKEVLFRFITTVLIVLTGLHVIRNFDVFISIYAFAYLFLVAIFLIYFKRKKQLHFSFSVSKVTRRFKRKILQLSLFIWGGNLVFNIATVFDSIVIAAVMPNGMASVGVFSLAQNISSLIQAPQRALVSSAIGPLVSAWREKDYDKINRIYHRSSINQLLFSTFMFCLIWLNFEDGVYTFHLQQNYLAAKWAFFFIGLYRIIDMGTGLNSQIIASSTYWRFDFFTGLILFFVMLPLSWQLARYYGIIGPAISNLVGFTIYNAIRFGFLWKKFKMQPFTWKSLWAILLAAASYFIVWSLFKNQQGFGWIILRSTIFTLLFAAGTFYGKLSPDVLPVWQTVKKRLGLGGN
jgi:O-antigen/teichoic acid export membrane protein